MNYIWISSFLTDAVLTWLYFRRSDFVPGRRRSWVKVVLCCFLLLLYPNSLIPLPHAAFRVIYRAVVYFLWLWLGEGIPRKGAAYIALFWTAVYTVFQNVFFGPYLAEIVTGRMDILPSHWLSQVLVSFGNVLARLLYVGVIAYLLPFEGMYGSTVAETALLVLINVILVHSKTAILTPAFDFQSAPGLASFFLLLQLALLLALITYEMSRRGTLRAAALELQNVAAQSLLKSIENHRTAADSARALRHDLKNHALTLQLLLEKNDVEGAKAYLEEFRTAVSAHAESYRTGSELLDGLLLQKLAPAAEKGVEIGCTLDFREGGFIDNFDLCVLMGNILDNAVEASLSVPAEEKPFIRISGGPAANCLLIRVENASSRKVSLVGGLPVTAKTNKEMHGFGLRNVKEVLERYGGTMTIDQTDKSYSIALLIPRPEP